MRNQRKIELLQAEVDEHDESYFRLLVDDVSIKYLTIETGIFSVEDMCFGPVLATILPEFPTGDWNDGLVAKGAHGEPHFARVNLTQFPSVQNTWHGTYVDFLELSIKQRLHTGIYEVKHPMFDHLVVVKFARFHWEIQYLENETTAYEWLSGHNIGPRFLGHLTENGRVIGFLMERITDARHATIEDTETCRTALSRLHDLGIRHGDVNRFNFLIRNSQAILMDFDTTRKCEDRDLLLQEFESLTASFEDLSARGGGGLL